MKNYHFSNSGTDDSYWRELTVVKKKTPLSQTTLELLIYFKDLKCKNYAYNMCYMFLK